MNSSGSSVLHSGSAESSLCQTGPDVSADLRSLAIRSLETNQMFRGRLAEGVINVEAKGDSLVLTGQLPTYYVKQLLQESLRRLDGVRHIENRIYVVAPGT